MPLSDGLPGSERDPARSLLVTDIDGTLVLEGERQPELEELKGVLSNRRFLFAVATGRNIEQIREVFDAHRIPYPDIAISDVGTAIRFGLDAEPDAEWSARLSLGWEPRVVESLVRDVPGVRLQEAERQGPFKVSFYVEAGFQLRAVEAAMAGQHARVIHSQNKFLDLLPANGSKGEAVQYLCGKLGIAAEQTIVCGDSGNDLDMLAGYGQGVVVSNYSPELEELRGRTYFAQREGAAGILDGMRHYGFSIL